VAASPDRVRRVEDEGVFLAGVSAIQAGEALVHGLRAESAVIPGEDQSKFDQLLERLSAAWMPQDDREKDSVEQIAVNQWKLVRIDRSDAMLPVEFALAIHRVYLTQARLERQAENAPKTNEIYQRGPCLVHPRRRTSL
jgi:hypothetical protein